MVVAGLIPAGAGNIRGGVTLGLVRGAHPRRCGEHLGHTGISRGLTGLIPAGAGNICSTPLPTAVARAHPRRCGEHDYSDRAHDLAEGSSPQVRGTSDRSRRRRPGHGLIPAGAGNISALPKCTVDCLGSSPQVRGTSTGCSPASTAPGLIPAGAGNIGVGPRQAGVHRGSSPQVRGTLGASRRAMNRYSSGSSPQVRGTFSLHRDRHPSPRLIPAGAGNIGG